MRFVGVSGIVNIDDMMALRRLQSSLQEAGAVNMRIAAGILQSQKSIEREELNPRTPHPNTIDALIRSAPGVLRFVHYFTKEPASLITQLDRLMSLAHHADGIQLNVAWPPTAATQWFRREYPSKRLILQLNRKAVEMESGDQARIAARVREYMPDITDLLVDMSGGTGLEIDMAWTSEMLEGLAILRSLGLGVGLAGGIGSRASIEQLANVWDEHNLTFIDTESKVRTRQDTLDHARVRTYATDAAELLRF
ncbi:hypothetical protein EKK58_05845 [Candidatus Dependentiae bacterium]|nr:MAG: hypothetical protein EKK58_05845 [Candidatus Dependentiae bacterium]